MITTSFFHYITNMCTLEITVYWMDNKFCLQQQLLSFIYLTSSYSRSLLASKVYQALDKYDLKKRLFCITGDNMANSMTIVQHFSNHLAIKDKCIWDPNTN